MLKPDAFIVAGTEREQREAQPDGRDPELGIVGDAGSWQTIVAPRGHHESFAETSRRRSRSSCWRARATSLTEARNAEKTDYLQVVQNYGLQAGALTDHLCLDFYDLPQIPHRIGEELGGAARYVIREGICPFCRLVRDEVADPKRLVFEDSASVAFRAVRVTLAVRAVGRAAPPRRRLRHGHGRAARQRRGDAPARAAAAGHARRSGLQPRPAHRAPARARRRDVPLALGDPPAPP